MNSVKIDIQWSPVHPNKFITWGTEICYYEVSESKEVNRQSCECLIIQRVFSKCFQLMHNN